jgi:TRAP-type C4-dicarboxylate transport system permease small subunit
MAAFDKALGWVSTVLAWGACAVIPVLCAMIVVDVSMRTLGANPPLWTSSVVEYALLYVTMLPAAWLVRERGHVAIEALVAALPRVLQTLLAYFVYLVCTVVSLLCAWFSWGLLVEALESGALDVRGVDMPTWLQYLPMFVGFTLVGLEFLMFLLGQRRYYSYDLGEVKDGV